MKFIRTGSSYTVAPPHAEIENGLPADYFRVVFDPKNGYSLEVTSKMSLPSRLYGPVDRRAERIYNTYLSRQGSTGVLLSGDKGSGKTMLARKICMQGVKDGVPVIICDAGSNIPNPGFSALLASFDFPFIALFDEFEKNFERVSDQSALLTVMDGLSTTRRLLLLTCNEQSRVSPYMLNRPGRIFYSFDYRGLDRNVIEEYCNDNFITENDKKNIHQFAFMTGALSFDGLQAIVEEINRYSVSFEEAIEGMNLGNAQGTFWNIHIEVDGELIDIKRTFRYGEDDHIFINLKSIINQLRGCEEDFIEKVKSFLEENKYDEDDLLIEFANELIDETDSEKGHITFIQEDGWKVGLTPHEVKEFKMFGKP